MKRIWIGTDKLDICHLQRNQMAVWLWQCVSHCKGDACTEVISHNDGVHHKLKLQQMSTICAADVYHICNRCLLHVRQMSTTFAVDVYYLCM